MDTTNVSDFWQPPTARQFDIKRVFLASLIVSLSISALITILVFLFGDFGQTELQLLFTTLTIGGYSLTGLCSAVLYDRREYIPLAFSGMIVSVLGFLSTVGVIWDIIDFNNIGKLVIIFIILAFSIAHSSLLLLVRSDKNLVNLSLKVTIRFIIIVALMLIYLVLMEFDYVSEFYYRLLGVFAVLDVLGTIVTPILKKFNS